MVNYEDLRRNLESKVKEGSKVNKDGCEHDFKKFKETVRPTNNRFQGRAFFIVKACLKCHAKKYVSYLVES